MKSELESYDLDNKKIIYIAGKYSGKTHIETEYNILMAKQAMLELSRLGWIVYCPHMNSAMLHIYKELSDEYWYAHGLKMLSKCDAIFMLPNYVDSKGAINEMLYAKELGIPIIRWGFYLSPKEVFGDE